MKPYRLKMVLYKLLCKGLLCIFSSEKVTGHFQGFVPSECDVSNRFNIVLFGITPGIIRSFCVGAL